MSGDNNMMKISKERKHWIDCLRGFCCLIVIIDHAEVYLTGDRITNYCWYSTKPSRRILRHTLHHILFFLRGISYDSEHAVPQMRTHLPRQLSACAVGSLMLIYAHLGYSMDNISLLSYSRRQDKKSSCKPIETKAGIPYT